MINCDIAIVGCGPVGALLGNLLALRGATVEIFERQPAPYPLPRAIHFDGEVMRIFQSAGLAREVLPHTHVGRGMLFKDSDGNTLIDWSREQVPGPSGWYESYRFHQPGVEQVLTDGLHRFPGVRLRRGVEATGLSQDETTVTTALSDGTSCRSRYLIACDGAQSSLRQGLGLGWTDLGFHERWLVIDAVLSRPRPDLGDHSVQYCHARSPATYVRGIGDRRRWEIRLEPGEPAPEVDAAIWQKLARWITPQDAILERSAVYEFRSGVATSWRDRRVLVAGDAAHQMPPFMGQGMCAGVRDTANLAWKLSAALGGYDSGILDTYQSEREANVRAFIDLSVALGRLINQTDPGRLPRGAMKSIWPSLGPGLGPRDGVGGTLVPQGRTAQGGLADDAAFPGFHVVSSIPLPDSPLPVFSGSDAWLKRHGVTGVIVRPDGYALAGFSNAADLSDLAARLPRLG